MNSLSLFNTASFITALKAFFVELQVPVNYIADEPAKPKDLLGEKYKPQNPTHALIADVYVLGMVDDAGFEGTNSFKNVAEVQKLDTDYDGVLIFGIGLHNAAATRSQLAEITRVVNRAFPYTRLPLFLNMAAIFLFPIVNALNTSRNGGKGKR